MTNVTSKSAEIVPDISLMKKMASISGTINSRIMELVDNSIDAKIPDEKLTVCVNVTKRGSKQSIEIIDDGSGMTEEIASHYFQLGKTQKLGQKKIGRFGLGSKVAILGIGNSCKVETQPLNEDYSIHIDFDIDNFKDWVIDYRVKKSRANIHGTKIKIENLTVRIGDTERFCSRLYEHFAKTYKHFIEKGEIIIKVNGKKVKPIPVDLIPGFFKEFDFESESGKKVSGWAGAKKEAGTNWQFGFNLINNGRIIKSNDLLNRQAHTSLARLVGEIHLDDFPTDIHKTDFMRDTEEWNLMQETLMNDVLNELLIKISQLTNREVFSKYQADMDVVSRTLNKVVRDYDFLRNIDLDEGVLELLRQKARKKRMKNKEKKDDEITLEQIDELLEMVEKKKEENQSTNDENDLRPKKPRRKTTQIGLVIEEPIPVSLGEGHPPKRWVVFDKEDGTHLKIEVNLDHPIYQKEEEVAILVRNVVLESVAEFILREEKRTSGIFEDEIERLNRIKDMLVRHSVKVG